MSGSKIIAMWSGPRNLSTAMMRVFGNRADCTAMDEPFYAAYLAATGIDHPMRDAVIAAGETDPQVVERACLGPFATPWCYQKHMPHHMVDGFPLDWAAEVTNVFLTRHPRRVLASYAKKHEDVAEADIGYRRMRELYDLITQMQGYAPLAVTSEDIIADPRAMIEALCAAIGMDFDAAMLSWEPGKRPEDGVWGAHWYDAIWKSTGLKQSDPGPLPDLPAPLEAIEAEALPHYQAMAEKRLRV